MNSSLALQTIGFEDNSLRVMARILGHAGTVVTQASLTAVTCKVYDTEDGSLIASPTVTISTDVFDTLQTSDPRWTLDSTGYNFAVTVPASAFPDGQKRYQVEFTFDPVSGDDFHFVVKHETIQLYSS